ncbi:two-component sensor histidine kinase [Nonomuraea sp. K274]|uniref:histidine kinase n=1 Tax=Nonomuraea cypriaca TaxID=1187855 RepID=A0A931EZS6_9ACTN|nr:sensor histidine kinase [Nonomuraea cypriaca]MBF8190159.1 two-component sensor histidine kinase [Nonomuraea cypriaca]
MTAGPWHRRHPLAIDVAIAVIFAFLDTGTTLLGLSWWPERPGVLAWVLLTVQAAACLTLIVRRRAPLAVLAVLGGFTLVMTLLIAPAGVLVPAGDATVWAPLATVPAAYAPLYYGRNRRLALAALAAFTIVIVRPWQPSLAVIVSGLLRTAVGPLLALYFDAHKRVVCMLTERAERAERERHLLAERARAEERARLAGEMHDVVTHRVSMMVLQAGALRVTTGDESVRRTAEELRAAGCQVLEELRDVVGVLRTPPGDEPPSAGDFAVLVAESTAVGTPAELVEDGDPALASPVVRRTAYRVVREALTNARKHAPGSRVAVRIEYDQRRVRIAVRNTAPSGRPADGLAETGSGLGIANLRQRIEVVQGTLRAGPAPGGGFQVEAVLPAYVPTAETAV